MCGVYIWDAMLAYTNFVYRQFLALQQSTLHRADYEHLRLLFQDAESPVQRSVQ